MPDADSNTADALGRILASVFGIVRRPYDTETQLWVKVAKSLGVRATTSDELEDILARIAATNPKGSGGPTPTPPTPPFIAEPSSVDSTPLVGLFSGFNGPASLPGVTSLTINHTTNTEGYDFSSADVLQTISFPNLTTLVGTGYISISFNDTLVTASFPKLTNGDIELRDNLLLTDLEFPELSACLDLTLRNNAALSEINLPKLTSTDAGFRIDNCDALTALNAPLLDTATTGTLRVTNNAVLASLSLPALVNTGGTNASVLLQISSNPMLVSLSVPLMVFNNSTVGLSYDFSGNALSAASVNAVLARAVASPGFTKGQLHLEGGTNAAPSGQGALDVITLSGRGVVVTTN